VVVVTIAYHYPTALADLKRYSAQFGLPVPNLTVVSLGSPPVNPGWNLEAALDLDMIHAMAPDARLVLVEAASNSVDSMMAAVDVGRAYAQKAGGGQVNGSWGSNEFSQEASFDSHFVGTNVVYFFSSGDNVAPSWPAVSSRVVAVGGTSTPRSATTGLYIGFETTWTQAGVGSSAYIARPSFQNGIAAKIGSRRAIPDVSADANPATGVWVHYNNGWYIVGGTSVSSPMVAGMVNRARKFRANSQAQNAFMYANVGTTAYHDVHLGKCGIGLNYATTVGAKAAAWDFCTGIGSPRGAAGL
jgi:subtilase family serine protease